MERYVIRGGRQGYDRLRVLARSWAETTSALLDTVGVHSGMTCLDLGCGAGDVTFELARRVGPEGRVVGVDLDEVKLGLARDEAARAGLTNVAFEVGNVHDRTEADAYDVVYSRNVLQHLTDPVGVLRAMWAAVRAGGVLVAEDADFSGVFAEPPNPGVDFWLETYSHTLRRNGGDPLSGRQLHRRFVAAGIPAPALTVVQRLDRVTEAKAMPRLTVEATAEAVIQAGAATPEQIDAAIESLVAYESDPDTIIGSPRLFQAWSRRA